MELLTNVWFCWGVALAGMFSHFLKKKIKGESLTEIKSYFGDNLKSTILAFIFTSIGFGAYWLMNDGIIANKDLLSIFLVGYLFDSMVNKWETKEPKI